MKKYLISYVTEFLLSDKRIYKNRLNTESKRKRLNQSHTVDVYIAIDDPASYLLLQILPKLKQRYNLTFKFKTVLQKQGDMYPEPQLWDKNVLNDCTRMAELYQLTKPMNFCLGDKLTQDVSLLLTQLENHPEFLTQAIDIFHAAWQSNAPFIEQVITEQVITDKLSADLQELKKQLSTNENDLLDQGHYLSGTLHYGGEWYWGLERLQYLEKRLNALFPFAPQVIKYNKLHDLYQPISKQIEDNTTPLTLYFSLRSPYSYLGLLRAIKLTEHYQIPLELKPVLPMLMRGMKVPKKKGMYIALDTKREAKSYGLAFGKIADPLGKGVERCYALFDYAKSQGKEIEFMKNYATAVWSQRVFSDSDNGLKHIVEKSDLDWQKAQSMLNNQSWRKWADTNLKELFDLGLWGVPSFKYKDTRVFGQDKLLFVEQAIRKTCR